MAPNPPWFGTLSSGFIVPLSIGQSLKYKVSIERERLYERNESYNESDLMKAEDCPLCRATAPRASKNDLIPRPISG